MVSYFEIYVYICIIKQINKAWGAGVIRSLSQLSIANIAKIRKPCLCIYKINKSMKVSVEDIMNIKPGKTKTFILGKPSECHSAKSLVSYVNNVKKPADISNYTTNTDWESNAISLPKIGN